MVASDARARSAPHCILITYSRRASYYPDEGEDLINSSIICLLAQMEAPLVVSAWSSTGPPSFSWISAQPTVATLASASAAAMLTQRRMLRGLEIAMLNFVAKRRSCCKQLAREAAGWFCCLAVGR